MNEECIIAILADLNYDGCVSVNDLLRPPRRPWNLPPYPEWPDEPTDTTRDLRRPPTYWDYDYATVPIGDQRLRRTSEPPFIQQAIPFHRTCQI